MSINKPNKEVDEVARLFRWFAARGEYWLVDMLANAISPEAVAEAITYALRSARAARNRAVWCEKDGRRVCCYEVAEGCKEGVVCGGREVCCVRCPPVPSADAVERVIEAVRAGVLAPAEIAAKALARAVKAAGV